MFVCLNRDLGDYRMGIVASLQGLACGGEVGGPTKILQIGVSLAL